MGVYDIAEEVYVVYEPGNDLSVKVKNMEAVEEKQDKDRQDSAIV